MPLPLVPLISAGTALLGGVASNASTARQNRLNRQFADQQYQRQRNDALADRAFENEYNSPAAQMERLKSAGLNPNLVYGNGANTQSVSTRQSQQASYKGESANWSESGAGINQSLLSMYDIEFKKAQTDNVKEITNTQKDQQALIAAQTAETLQRTKKTSTENERGMFDLAIAKALEGVTLEGAKLGVEKQKADITYTLDNNDRQKLLTSQSLEKGVVEILNTKANTAQTKAQEDQIRQQIKLLKQDEILKDLEINLRRAGINPHDPMYARIIGQAIQDPAKVVDKIKSIIPKLGGFKDPKTKGFNGWPKLMPF